MTAHNHTDDRLTFGCPGCIAKVQKDQAQALRAQLPLRELVVRWEAVARQHGETTIEVHAFADDDPKTLARDADHELWEHICEACDFDPDDYEVWDAELGDVVEGPPPRIDGQVRLA